MAVITITNDNIELFAKDNMPIVFSQKPQKPILFINNFADKKPELRFFTQNGLNYKVLKNNKVISNFTGNNNEIYYIDKSSKAGEINSYKIAVQYNNTLIYSNETKVLCLI